MKKIMFSDNYGLTEAVLSGRKTQTRRIIKNKNMIARHWNPVLNAEYCYYTDERGKCQLIDADTNNLIVPSYQVGEVVAVAQSYKDAGVHFLPEEDDEFGCYDFPAEQTNGWNNKSCVRSALMPHQIRITDVRVERLQDISDEDCIKEGIWMAENVGFQGVSYWYPNLCNSKFKTPREAYASLMDKVSGQGTWERNPYVFVYEFEIVK